MFNRGGHSWETDTTWKKCQNVKKGRFNSKNPQGVGRWKREGHSEKGKKRKKSGREGGKAKKGRRTEPWQYVMPRPKGKVAREN